jgi:2-dehydro-3-deoxyglucarate aldolase/4-hydroxy-2-oxoheptanedioate aldolase
MPIPMHNPVKESLAKGGRAYGTMLTSFAWTGALEILSASGWQFVVIDTEHSLFNHESLEMMLRAGRQCGIVPLVRPADADYHLIARMLDIGAYGVMVPRVDTVAEATQIGLATRYPPVGQRGAGGNLIGFSGLPLPEYLQYANQSILTAIMMESGEAVSIVDQIAAVPNTDVLVIGPTDLSINLGIPGQTDHAKFGNAADKIVAACEKHGKAAGIHVGSVKECERWASRGFRYLMCSADAAMLRSASNEMAAAMKEICAGKTAPKKSGKSAATPY